MIIIMKLFFNLCLISLVKNRAVLGPIHTISGFRVQFPGTFFCINSLYFLTNNFIGCREHKMHMLG